MNDQMKLINNFVFSTLSCQNSYFMGKTNDDFNIFCICKTKALPRVHKHNYEAL